MFTFSFESHHRPLRTILCLGAHSDDIEIGCGGAVLRLLRLYPELTVHWIVLSANKARRAEAEASAAEFLQEARTAHIDIKNFTDGHFPFEGVSIKTYFESIKDIDPDLIFAHCRHDLHQDHRLMAELTWNTFRNHLILEYEIPKYDGDLGSPNFFIQLEEDMRRRKVSLLLKHFATQSNRYWFTQETFDGLMRIRGIESRAPSGFAEAFYCRKAVV